VPSWKSVARYLSQLDTADRQEPTEALAAKVTRLTEKLTKLKEEMDKLPFTRSRCSRRPDQQISLTDPDSRSMATSGRGSGVVGYNVQVAVDSEHHLIGRTRSRTAAQIGATCQYGQAGEGCSKDRDARGGCRSRLLQRPGESRGPRRQHGNLPKRRTSGAKSEGRFGKQDFAYLPGDDASCPAGERCRIAITNKKTARCCALLPRPVKIVRSNRNARRARAADYAMGA